MRALLALIRREYLEHRGAFVYAPVLVIAVLTLAMVLALTTGNIHVWLNMGLAPSGKIFQIGYFAAAAIWWVYLLLVLFFYFADAFSADRRNNALFFWKSMPQSDFTILVSKMTAGVTIFPALIFIAFLVTGLLLILAAFAAPLTVPVLQTPDLIATGLSWVEVSVVAFCYLVLALLWYMPFFAWVGALSTIFGRWSIPLALLAPVTVSFLEGVVNFGSAPGGSYVLAFLRSRISFNFDGQAIRAAIISSGPLDVPGLIGGLISGVDWLSLAGGLVFAVLAIYAASQYRRHRITG